MVGVVDFRSLRKYDLGHVFKVCRSYILDDPIFLFVDGELKEKERERVEKVCKDNGVEIKWEKIERGRHIRRQTTSHNEILFVSKDKRLINSVADVYDFVIFVLPQGTWHMRKTLEGRGHRCYTHLFVNRIEGAIARVLRVGFEDILKAKETKPVLSEEELLKTIGEGVREKDLYRLYTDIYGLKLTLAKYVLEGKLFAIQKEGEIYYYPRRNQEGS